VVTSFRARASLWQLMLIKSFRKLVCVVYSVVVAVASLQSHSAIGQSRAGHCALCLYGPDNMVFDGRSEVYLVDTDHKSNSRILKLSTNGRKLADWRVFADVPRRRNGPEGIALDRDGEVFVTDAGARQILKLSPAGGLLLRIGSEPGTFKDLGHIAVLPNGRVCVSESDSSAIQVFDPRGVRVARWTRNGGGDPNGWKSPESIASLGDGSLVVEDWGNHRIDIVLPGGKVLRSFGRFGNGPGEIMNSAGIAVDKHQNIYVADYYLRRIQEFGRVGKLIRVIENSRGQTIFNARPGGVAVDPDGNLYSPDGLSVVKYSPEGRLLQRWQ
jgi:DNA-binding beta-propeller fold protein YncE